ncbi:MAG: FTR1 family protein [Candidatus Peregrinibacteria bacterium]|nr:FTR1 family protein [Candidatus Peregrinibacteria bacterium]
MLSVLFITLREALEASLVVGIILAYIAKTSDSKEKKNVWLGVLGGAIFSFVFAYFFQKYVGEFEGVYEQIYEGTTMLVASLLVSWMLYWMITNRKNFKSNMENKVSGHISNNSRFGIFFLSFVAVMREGVEAAMFLQGAKIEFGVQGMEMIYGTILGIAGAVLVAWLVLKGILKFSLKYFFNVSAALLIIFAADLFVNGILELMEAAGV